MATELQTAVCRAVLQNVFTAYNGGLPVSPYTFDAADFQVWSDGIGDTVVPVPGLPTGRALAATVGSCVAAGLMGSDGECVWLTKEGFDVAMAASGPSVAQ